MALRPVPRAPRARVPDTVPDTVPGAQANPDTGAVHSLSLDPKTGLITGVVSTLGGFGAASSIVAWAP